MNERVNKQKTEISISQADKFKAMAKELEADSDEKSFDKTLSKIAKNPPKDTNK